MRIAVAGGTGLIGTMVAEIALAAGHQVVVLARGRGVDLVVGDGLTAALHGVDAVIDVTNVTTLSAKRSTTFFAAETANLLAAEKIAGVSHHLVLSIVGVDRAPYGYTPASTRRSGWSRSARCRGRSCAPPSSTRWP